MRSYASESTNHHHHWSDLEPDFYAIDKNLISLTMTAIYGARSLQHELKLKCSVGPSRFCVCYRTFQNTKSVHVCGAGI